MAPSAFASNEFDASRFFGLDEEEEDQNIRGGNQPTPFTLGGEGPPSENSFPSRSSNAMPETNPEPFMVGGGAIGNQVDPGEKASTRNNVSSSSLESNHRSFTTEQHDQGRPISAEPNTNANNPVSDDALLALFGAAPSSEATPTSPRQTPQNESIPNQAIVPSVDFVLPSQSSSDDSSDEDS